MIIYPTIELQKGRCVSLVRGRLEEPQIWHMDPVDRALEYAQAGAEWLQVTDLDAIAGEGDNEDLICEIIRKAGIPVQVAGGVRSRERLTGWIERGAGRVTVGTLAVRDPDQFKALAYQNPDQVVLAVDVYQGRVMTDGWRSPAAFTPEAFLEAFSGSPLAGVLVTDIDNDIEDGDASLGLISGLAESCRWPVIASGLAQSLDDISRLKYVRNVSGAIVGRALLRKRFTLEEALELAAAPLEPTAEFL